MGFTSSSTACTAYSRYILDVGQSGDWLALQMALAPCLIGYGAVARRLHSDKNTLREGNQYWKWIENYVADDYTEAVRLGSGKQVDLPSSSFNSVNQYCIDAPCSMTALLEDHVQKVSPNRLEELIRIFIRATELEINFWDMGLSSQKV